MTDGKQLMTGKRGLVMGVANERSIAWGIAQRGRRPGRRARLHLSGRGAGQARPAAGQVARTAISSLPCDVTDDASIDAVFAEIGKRWGKIDFLVHAIAFSDKEELKGKYLDTTARQLRAHAGYLLLLLHRRLPARGEADARMAAAC